MIDLRRPPAITGRNADEKISAIQSYLYQFVEQLEWAFNNISTENTTAVTATKENLPVERTETSAANTFNAIKTLIIKSADIVNAYYEQMSERFDGGYVAQSQFGTYEELTSQTIEKSDKDIKQLFENIQTIDADIAEINSKLLSVDAYIKSGLLDYDESGIPVYGIEIGQKNKVDGAEVFNKFARFSANRLSFYDQNSIEVAWISDYMLHITDAEITGTLYLGGYKIDTTNGIVFH